ncbi:MAG: N-acetyl-gamma-glutamyl-phosphate reductase, partial [Candidatus Korarchaeota archaeon]|nr:N-acetyl-gamma-glutamyl-phosphate reductase [Candidatus Korarchaeota archaeon]
MAVFGASGYTGGELLRILISHPAFTVTVITSREYSGKPVYMAHPHLKGLLSLKFVKLEEALNKEFDYALLALPHGISKEVVPLLLEMGVGVVDLGADFRLKDS